MSQIFNIGLSFYFIECRRCKLGNKYAFLAPNVSYAHSEFGICK